LKRLLASKRPLPGHRPGHRVERRRGPARWQRQGLILTALALVGSGGLWLALHYSVGAGAGELPHPLESALIKLHGLAAFAALFLFGALAAAHIPQGWRLSAEPRRHPRQAAQRGSGIALCALGGVLMLSAYLLYYFAPETLRPGLGWAHAAAGLAMVAVALRHGRLHKP
jgi:hypothetical protein